MTAAQPHAGPVAADRPVRGRRLPARWAPIVFGALLSALMTVIVAGVSTVRAVGLDHFTIALWGTGFISSWPVAFPTVLIVAPIVRRLVTRLVAPPPTTSAENPRT